MNYQNKTHTEFNFYMIRREPRNGGQGEKKEQTNMDLLHFHFAVGHFFSPNSQASMIYEIIAGVDVDCSSLSLRLFT